MVDIFTQTVLQRNCENMATIEVNIREDTIDVKILISKAVTNEHFRVAIGGTNPTSFGDIYIEVSYVT